MQRFRTICHIAAAVSIATELLGAQALAPESPTIAALEKAGTDTLSTAVDLWSILSSHPLPLVEFIPGDPTHRLVTFVWHGDSATHNVVVITPLILVDFSGSIMRRLPGSAVWYKTVLLPSAARFVYRFLVNDDLVPFEQDRNPGPRFAALQQDPTNPKAFDFGPFGIASVLELPDAPSDSLTHTRSVPHGQITRDSIPSRALGAPRTVWTYTPPGYTQTGRAYPLVVFADGESYQRLIPTPTILDNLIAEHAIPSIVAVFVDTPNGSREEDLNCNPKWDDFLARDVLPWAIARYHASSEARRHVIAGYSLGGLAAACAAIWHPESFGGVIAQSGSFFRAPPGEPPEWVARHLASSPRLPLRFELSIGQFETAAIPSRDPSMLTASRHLRDVLVAKGYPVMLRELASGHEHVAWRATLGPALVALLADR